MVASPDATGTARSDEDPRLSGFARALLAPAFGAAIAISYALAWLFLERSITPRVLNATAYFALAGTLSAGAALAATGFLTKWRWGIRLAVAVLCLTAGTLLLAALFMMLQTVLTYHRLSEIPIGITIAILGISGAGALYNVLTSAAPLILPLGAPVIVLFAVLIARVPR